MGHPAILHPEDLGPRLHEPRASRRPDRSVADQGPGAEDDRALARMLGAAFLVGVGLTGGTVWGLWHLAGALGG